MHDFLLGIYIVVAIAAALLIKRTDRAFRYVAIYIIYTALSEWVAIIMINQSVNNLIVLDIYVLTCAFLFYFIFKGLWLNNRFWKIQNRIFITGLILIVGISIYTHASPIFPWLQLLLLSLLIIYNCLIVLQQMLDEPIEMSLFQQSKFWLCSIVFIYHAGTFFYWCMFNFLNIEALKFMWMFNIILCCFFYPILTFSVYLNTREKRQPTFEE
jgi:hypothetical protein